MRYGHVLAALWLGLSSAAAAETEPPLAPLPRNLIAAGVLAAPNQTPLDLETALQWTLSSNPDLVALRQNLCVSWLQPIELGRRRFRRSAIAQAAYTETQWSVLQAELLALVQTYRLHQTATYRREKLRVAQQLAEFNVHLLEVVRRQVEAAQLSPADLVLAEVENQSIPSVGPVYESDESGTTFYGLEVSTPVPVLNSGRTLVYQREMEHSRDLVAMEQVRIRTIARVTASLVKWNQTKNLVAEVYASTEAIQGEAKKMERLYSAGQTDLLKLLQVRQRLIEAENARLDLAWQATQAYADVLAAAGAAPLLASAPPEAQGPESPGKE
jgi:outer membrane protein TolC